MNPFDMLRCEIYAFMNFAPFSCIIQCIYSIQGTIIWYYFAIFFNKLDIRALYRVDTLYYAGKWGKVHKGVLYMLYVRGDNTYIKFINNGNEIRLQFVPKNTRLMPLSSKNWFGLGKISYNLLNQIEKI
jgi:hypothetical protein